MAALKVTGKEDKNVVVTDLVEQLLGGPEFQFEYTLVPSKRFPSYKGKFIFRFPTIEDEMTAARLQAQMRGYTSPIAFDMYQNALFDAISWLKVITIGAPQWFVKSNDGGEQEAMPEKVADAGCVLTLYGAWRKWERSFRSDGEGEPEGDSAGQSA